MLTKVQPKIIFLIEIKNNQFEDVNLKYWLLGIYTKIGREKY